MARRVQASEDRRGLAVENPIDRDGVRPWLLKVRGLPALDIEGLPGEDRGIAELVDGDDGSPLTGNHGAPPVHNPALGIGEGGRHKEKELCKAERQRLGNSRGGSHDL